MNQLVLGIKTDRLFSSCCKLSYTLRFFIVIILTTWCRANDAAVTRETKDFTHTVIASNGLSTNFKFP